MIENHAFAVEQWADTSESELVRKLLWRAITDPDTSLLLNAADDTQRRLANALETRYPRVAFAQLLALRVVNLVLARHHFEHRHTTIASRPFQLMVDPANNCHLSCPGCLHSANPNHSGHYDWPGGVLEDSVFARLLEEHGPLAWGGVMYNWGEPLLNKHTPRLLRAAKRFLLNTFVSTNFSVRFDERALVESGLNFLFLSIDGATQETYSRFRRGGNLRLCLENIRRLIEVKRELGARTPFVLWRFLTFEHNVHEVEAARLLATELGVDQFSVTTPFSVGWDDPEVRSVRSPLEGTYLLRADASFRGDLDDWRTADLEEAAIAREFGRPWRSRLPESWAVQPSCRTSPTCRWLYQNLTLDARARLFPCCMAPERLHHKVYGSFAAEGGGSVNAGDFVLSRLAFADRGAFDVALSEAGGGTAPYCSVCSENPDLTYTLDRDVRRDLRLADVAGCFGDALLTELTTWPQSR